MTPRTVHDERPERMLNREKVLDRLPFGATKLYHLVKENQFPKPKRFGKRLLCWRESEVDEWIRKFFDSQENPENPPTTEASHGAH